MTASTEYNGWKNRQTWNVALYLANEEHLYRALVARKEKILKARNPYILAIRCLGLMNEHTPDNISYSGSRLAYRELNEFVRDLVA